MEIVDAAGVDRSTLREVLSSSDPESKVLYALEGMLADPGSRPRRERLRHLLEKDLAAAQDLADGHGISEDFVRFVRSRSTRLLQLQDAPDGSEDDGEARYEKGRFWMDAVYGPGFHDKSVVSNRDPFNRETVEHLFGEVWSRPALSLRDRRLLVIGISAMLGRSDLIEVQVLGALSNGELTLEELDEMALHLVLYVGWPNGSAVNRGISTGRRAYEESRRP
jgi:alkylhydroperoxidase/carboxymuconolactone decarboxylase family protein YurZ